MGRFDDFGDGKKMPLPALTGTPAAADATKQSVAQKMAEIDRLRSRGLAIALDATGSMEELIDIARRTLGQIMTAVAERAKIPVATRLYVYRDYDCMNSTRTPLLEVSERSTDPGALVRWLADVSVDGGGGNGGEAVEVALHEILKADESGVVLLAGDEPSNSEANIAVAGRSFPTARQLASRLGERHIPIYAFQVGDWPETQADFRQLALNSGGEFGLLKNSRDMIDMAVLAILNKLHGVSFARDYMENTRLSTNAAEFAQRLLPTSRR